MQFRIGFGACMRLAAIALATTMVGCTTAGAGAPGEELEGTDWVVVELTGSPSLSAPPPTLRFEGGRVSGSDGCNRYSAGYRSDAGRFELLGNTIGTKRVCAEPQMRTAAAFTSALAQARGLRRNGSRLQLLDASGATLAILTSQQAASTR